MSSNPAVGAVASSQKFVGDVPVLIIHVESPNVLFVRKYPLSNDERDFLRAVEDYCGRIHAKSASGWRASLNDRQLNLGDKYFVLDGRQGGTQWRRGLLTNVVSVRGGHRLVEDASINGDFFEIPIWRFNSILLSLRDLLVKNEIFNDPFSFILLFSKRV